jgi:hypothetical protein
MTISYAQYTPITGSIFLEGLLGQTLYSQLLHPPQSSQSGASATGSQTLTAAEALDAVFLSPQAQALLQQASDTTLNYGGDIKGDLVVGQGSPEQDARRVAGETTHESNVSADVNLSEPNASLANQQTPADLNVSNIAWGWDSAGDETLSSQSLDISRDATGALQIYLRYYDDVGQGSGYTNSATNYLIKIAPSGAVNFDVTDTQGAVSYDSSGNRSIGWASTELNLNDTPAGTVATLTQDDGNAYDARDGSVDRSTDVRVTETLDDAGATTSSNAAVQLLAASIQRFSDQNAPQFTKQDGYVASDNAAVGQSPVATPQESASALIKTLVFA